MGERSRRFLLPPFLMALAIVWGYPGILGLLKDPSGGTVVLNGEQEAAEADQSTGEGLNDVDDNPRGVQSTVETSRRGGHVGSSAQTGGGGNLELGDIIKLIVGGFAVLAVGYLVAVVATAILRLAFLIPWGKHYQAAFSKKAVERMATYLSTCEDTVPTLAHENGVTIRRRALYVVSLFRHRYPSEPTRKWLIRRYGVFAESFNSFVGLGAVYIYSLADPPNGNRLWSWVVPLIALVFLVRAILAHIEHNKMIAFLAECAQQPPRDAQSPQSNRETTGEARSIKSGE